MVLVMPRSELSVAADVVVTLMDNGYIGKDKHSVNTIINLLGLTRQEVSYAAERHARRERRPPIFTGYTGGAPKQDPTPTPGPRRGRTRAGVFGDAVEKGNVNEFAKLKYKVGGGKEKPLGDMTASDHRFVAGEFDEASRRCLMLRAFHEAVALKVGDLTTGEVFTVDQYRQLEANFNPFQNVRLPLTP